MAIADRTGGPGQTLEEFKASLGDRLMALSRVQGLLARAVPGEGVTFDGLLDSEMSAHSENRGAITLDGPLGILLNSGSVQALAMALHELTTNALKYGALGRKDARLKIGWRVRAENGSSWIFVDWKESGVETIEPNGHWGVGHGRRLIDEALPYQFGARTTFEIEPDGVHCTIALPLSGPQTKEIQDDQPGPS
jgi:two-component sensor histidine kinase